MKRLEKTIALLPRDVGNELFRIIQSRGMDYPSISEISIRAYGRSHITACGEKIFLFSRCTCEELIKSLMEMCDGALYAYRDTIKEGFVTLKEGVRVGIVSDARYDGGTFVGVGEVRALIIRFPGKRLFSYPKIEEIWKTVRRGMLIFSPPGVGKTSALRSLAYYIGSGKEPLHVAVIDERREFFPPDYSNSTVDIYTGYPKGKGIEIALRTSAPDVILVDEVGRKDEIYPILDSLNTGIRVVATAHGASVEELKKRLSVQPYFESGAFDVFVGISIQGRERVTKITRSDD